MCFSRARMRYYWDERVRHVALSGANQTSMPFRRTLPHSAI